MDIDKAFTWRLAHKASNCSGMFHVMFHVMFHFMFHVMFHVMFLLECFYSTNGRKMLYSIWFMESIHNTETKT